MNIKTTRLKRWLLPCLILSSLVTKAQQPFGAGNLVVERLGDGTAALSSAAAAVFLDEYTPSGTLVQSIAMPTATSGSNHMLTESGSATSDGYLHLSPNGKYLAVPGYDAAVGTASVASTVSATVNRVVGIVNSQGVVATTAAFSNIASGNNLRSAITTDSVNIWVGAGSSGGVYYGTAASATAVNLSTTSTNVRCVNIVNGQLYTSSSSGTLRIAAVGTGLPTVAGQTIVNLPGMPTSGGSPYDFTMITLSNGNSVVYVADDGAGIMKYSNVSGTWTANGSVGTGSDGYRGITASVRNDTAFIYAATGAKMVAVVDGNGFNTSISSANTTLTTIVTASANKVFRGIAFAPQCAAPTITNAPTAQSTCVGGNATFTVTASGTGLTYQWMKNGTPISGASTNSYTITGAASTDAGNYSVAVTACSSTTTTPVALTVNAPTATVTAAGATTFCAGSSVVLNANTGTGLTYQWSNGTNISGATNASYTATAAGNYTVTVSSGSCSATATATTVTVNPAPTATITAATATTFCAGGSVVLNANTGSGLTYQWSNGTNISGATNASYTANAAGNYTVTVSNGTCSTTSSATSVMVNSAPTATITAATATTFCAGDSVVLNANTGTGLTYQWSNGTNISGATNASYTATAAGNYTVTVSNGSCSATSTATAVTVNPAPSATATAAGSTNLCSGGSVVLNANTGTGLTYQWSNGTNISGATNASYTATAAGSYTVTVSNGTCAATSTAITVNVLTGAGATITPATSTTFCTGGSVVLNANTGTGLTYQWSNGTNISGATNASYTANAAGGYTVTVSNGTCAATSTATTVTVNSLPTATITAATATTFCTGGSVVLNANTGTGLTYQWINGGNNISGATSASYTATAAGTYTVKVTNASTCTATSTATTVTVNALPTATITPATSTTFCTGGSVVLNANTGTGLTYQWSNGTNISGATGASYTATAAGSYTVTVSNGTCNATSTATTITVNAIPTAAITAVTDTTFCAGDSVKLNANTGTGLTYQWMNGANTIAGATTASYTTGVAGVYSVSVTSTGCTAASNTKTVTVNALPSAAITPATATTFCAGGSVVLNANTGTGLTYQWKQNGNAVTGATASNYSATANGSYTVTVSNGNNCKATATAQAVVVNPLPTATIAQSGMTLSVGSFSTYQWYKNNQPITGATSQTYTVTQNGSYYAVVTNSNSCMNNSDTVNITNVGVENLNNGKNAVTVYPNPAQEVVFINAPVAVNVTIRNINGQVVFAENNTRRADISRLANGLYMIFIVDEKGQLLLTEKLMKNP